MAYPSVTYTFTNGTTASATEVNQNFTDLINGLSDGTKDLSISALTVAGTASLNGAVNIGNATSDDIAVNGYITTALIPKADDSYDLGTAALAWQDAYFDGAVYTDTISELTGAAGVTIDETKLKDGGVILKTGSEISDAGGKYVKIKGGDGSGAVAAGYIGEVQSATLSAVETTALSGGGAAATATIATLTNLGAGTWLIIAEDSVYWSAVPTTSGKVASIGSDIYNGSSVLSDGKFNYSFSSGFLGTNASLYTRLNHVIPITLSATTTITFRLRCDKVSGDEANGAKVYSTGLGVFKAIRIA